MNCLLFARAGSRRISRLLLVTELKFEKHDPPLLFDLEADPSEKFNLAAEHPQRVAEIIQEADKHRASLVVGKPQY
jgi:arylsulfatase A-like enzyme